MNVQTFSDIYNKEKNLFVSNQNKVSDLNSGSTISSIFESVARIIERFYIDVRNGYTNNLMALAYSIFGFKKKEGIKATANVVFSRTKTIDEESVIAIGTRVSSGSYIFETTEVGKILAGELDSGLIPVQAVEVGVEYNVAANTINTIETVLSEDIVVVNNPMKASSGASEETDTEMLNRFKIYLNGLQGTTDYGLKSKLLSLDSVRSVSIEEHFPPLDHLYNATIYVDDGTGGMTTELKNQVLEVINGDGTSTNPGCRAIGVQYYINTPTPVPISISLSCKIFRTEHTQASYDIQNAIAEEINSLGIGEDVIISSLIVRLRRISYVRDVLSVTINGSSSNVTIDKSSIARLSATNINLIDM